MNRLHLYSLFLLGFVFVSAVQANTIFVTDSLQLKLRATANTEGDIVTTLRSGQKLSLLERQSKFSRVRTEDGKTGWVQSWFLTDEPPATYIVDQVTKQKEVMELKLSRANEKLKNFDSATAQENKSLKNTIGALTKKVKKISSENEALVNEVYEAKAELAKYKFAEKYDLRIIILGFFLASFILGFWAARTWTRLRERRRLSGYRLAY